MKKPKITIFRKMLTATVPVLTVTGVVWGLTTIYFGDRNEEIHSLRDSAHRIQIFALQMRREQDEFFLQDIYSSDFYKTGSSANITGQAEFLSVAKEEISRISKATSAIAVDERQTLTSLLEKSSGTFMKIVSSFQVLGPNGMAVPANIERVKRANSALMMSFYEDLRAIEPLVAKILEETDRIARNEERTANMIFGMVLSLSIILNIVIMLRFAHAIVRPLEFLRERVGRFKEGMAQFQPSPVGIVEMDSLDASFSEMTISLEKAQKQLIQAQKMESIGILAGGIAHDFNNLLAGILGYAGVLRKKATAKGEVTTELDTIIASAEHGAGLTRQILGFARKGNYEKSRIDVNSSISECQRMLDRTLGKDVTIQLSLCSNLDAVMADPGQLMQVLMNLGINARDAMPNGGLLLIESQMIDADEVFCKVHGQLQPGRYVRISVCDTGTGMPKHVLEKIFDPFFTTKEVGKGTGLGLSMVYGIIESHKGHISVYSEVGHGTQFHLYFPSAGAALKNAGEVSGAPAAQPKAQPVVDARPALAEGPLLSGAVIMVVDDEKIMRDIARELLEPEGATLFFAANGEEAVEFLEKNHEMISLLLTDIVMPKMNGILLARAMKVLNPLVPIIFSSGYADMGELSDARRELGCAFIQKPYKSESLLALILQELHKAEAFRDKAA